MSLDCCLLCFFHDQSPEKKIQKSIDREIEQVFLRALEKYGLPGSTDEDSLSRWRRPLAGHDSLL